MADKKLSQLPSTATLTDDDQFYTNDSGTSKRIGWDNLRVAIRSGLDADAVTLTEAKTEADSPVSVSDTDTLKSFTNEGATASVTFDLPAAVIGLQFSFVCVVAQTMTITPNGVDTIADQASDSIVLDVVGQRLTLRCYVTGAWALEDQTLYRTGAIDHSSGTLTVKANAEDNIFILSRSTASTVNLPQVSTWKSRPLIIANNTGSNVSVTPFAGDSVTSRGTPVLFPGAVVSLVSDNATAWFWSYLQFGKLPTSPASGSHVIGDIVFNSGPGPGEPIGWVSFTGGTPGLWQPLPYFPNNIINKDENDSPVLVTDSEDGAIFTNSGATAEVEFDLPTAEIGDTYTFARVDNAPITIDPNGSEIIGNLAAGEPLKLATNGSRVTLKSVKTGEWTIDWDENEASAIEAKTVNDTLSLAYKKQIFSNTGATQAVTLTLPTATAGYQFEFVRLASFGFRIKPAAGEFIGEGANDKYLEMLKDNSKVVVKSYVSGSWVVETETGMNIFEA